MFISNAKEHRILNYVQCHQLITMYKVCATANFHSSKVLSTGINAFILLLISVGIG